VLAYGTQVLHCEQMLTTGGGWQDQVGGLSPGVKVGHSKAEIPVKIDVTFLKVSDEVIRSFGDQLVLVYTGKTRLARNLLQVMKLVAAEANPKDLRGGRPPVGSRGSEGLLHFKMCKIL